MSMQDFEAFIESIPAREGPFKPFVYYDPDGDCVEVFESDENYYGKSIGPHLTVYISEETGKIIGAMIGGLFKT
jgi:hypothetical protein